MANLSDDSEPDPPNLRFLRRLVTVLTGLLIAAIIVALVAIVVKLATDAGGDGESGAAPWAASVPLLPGETLVDSEVERGLIYLRIANAGSGSARVVVIRASSGDTVGAASLEAPE